MLPLCLLGPAHHVASPLPTRLGSGLCPSLQDGGAQRNRVETLENPSIHGKIQPTAALTHTLPPHSYHHLQSTCYVRCPLAFLTGVWSSSYRRENNPGAAQLPRRRTQLTVIKEDGLEERTISVTCVHLTHYPTCAPARPGVYRYYLNTFTNIK